MWDKVYIYVCIYTALQGDTMQTAGEYSNSVVMHVLKVTPNLDCHGMMVPSFGPPTRTSCFTGLKSSRNSITNNTEKEITHLHIQYCKKGNFRRKKISVRSKLASPTTPKIRTRRRYSYVTKISLFMLASNCSYTVLEVGIVQFR